MSIRTKAADAGNTSPVTDHIMMGQSEVGTIWFHPREHYKISVYLRHEEMVMPRSFIHRESARIYAKRSLLKYCQANNIEVFPR